MHRSAEGHRDQAADVTLIAAMSRDRVIGAGDGMPWDVPEEYAGYVETVRGATVVFGRRSYEIFGADLDDSELVVLTRNADLGGVATAA
ncbi:MAG: dihydrofolate reductase, partial [Planctomycetota bacterium]